MVKIVKRVFLGLILLFSVVFLPWWTTLSLVLVSVFLFEFYLEAVLIGFLMDSLYGFFSDFWHLYGFAFFVFTSVLFLLSFPIKERLRFY